ncbi:MULTISPECIES: hypothetical protein [Enterovibrio]|uniref:DUF4280 domain-containing protein n=2 Tax=Enterovibrio norvegicus TaxID=188144 RepID=A0A1I5JDS1_9GAMM|nr:MULTISPECIES: hypothetical protein [Enterovibrio]MBE1273629.1 hypothetical protein [Enterovibrio baiacu]PMI31778.1 hypothetical protein BCU47_14470 [Enterovibrio norvegicus]PMN70248.1 hypothetical protein BCT27_18065 [Enterovibrio norvegicus]PMN89783.1 hypothetical protein BCT23_21975 [Enterovibrio norvegicus]TKF17533.1 hypothetical protein FCV66_04870 [Enterovibrio norvegicus]
MPGNLLHVGATVMCSHGGQANPTVPNPRVMVSGNATVLQTAPYTVAGCAMPPPTAGNGPCVTAQWVTGTVRVLSLGQPLVLNTSQSVCAPTGTPLIPSVVQPRVVAS